MYDLSFLEKHGVSAAEFVKCNAEFLALQQGFLEDLLDFAERCAARGVELDVEDFLIQTMKGLLDYVMFIVNESKE